MDVVAGTGRRGYRKLCGVTVTSSRFVDAAALHFRASLAERVVETLRNDRRYSRDMAIHRECKKQPQPGERTHAHATWPARARQRRAGACEQRECSPANPVLTHQID